MRSEDVYCDASDTIVTSAIIIVTPRGMETETVVDMGSDSENSRLAVADILSSMANSPENNNVIDTSVSSVRFTYVRVKFSCHF